MLGEEVLRLALGLGDFEQVTNWFVPHFIPSETAGLFQHFKLGRGWIRRVFVDDLHGPIRSDASDGFLQRRDRSPHHQTGG